MNLQDSYLKAFNPSIAVKIEDLDGKGRTEDIVQLVFSTLSVKYRIFLDKRNEVIYIGRKLK